MVFRVLAVSALLSALACGSTDIPVLSTPGEGGTTFGDGGAVPTAGGQTRSQYCASSGSPLLVAGTCSGQLAQNAFRYALCTCGGYVSNHTLSTDSFDGTAAPYAASTAKAGGSVGTNGNLNATAAISVGGSLWASDSSGMTTSALLSAAGELHAQGEVHSGPTLSVGASAWMAGGVQTSGDVSVVGTLYVPASAPMDIGGTRRIGAIATGPVQVGPACDCAPQDLVDVAGFAEAHRATNDDAAMGIDPHALQNVQAPVALAIPCGRAFFTTIAGVAPIRLSTQGHVAIFVGGDLSTTSDFSVDAPPGSDVDVFVEGGVTVGGAFAIGDPSNPARARTYVGGTGTVNLQGASQLAGNLYAPHAEVVLGGSAATTLYGAIFAARLSAAADLTIHYDESILGAGARSGCAAPTTCSTCADCGGQACNGGACGACTDSSQCCAPLVCSGGACMPEII